MSKLIERIRMSQSPLLQKTQKSQRPSEGQTYTSYAEDLPKQISYQNVKLANFIELELIDLESTIIQNQKKLLKNPLKDCLSRSYNIFHEMEKLYKDLGMAFLYSQVKKLISCYGIIFVLLTKDKKEEKYSPDVEKSKEEDQVQIKNSYEKPNLQQKERSKLRKLGGVHLYNESYTRHIDYDIEEIRSLRQKNKEKKLTGDDLELQKKENDRKLREQIQQELEDTSYMRVEGEEIALYLQQMKNLNFNEKHISLGDQLQEIAKFFKESQNQALQFLRKSKNQESFHELTEGFNIIVQDYKLTKSSQIKMVKRKMKNYYNNIMEKNHQFKRQIQKKDKEIEKLKNQIAWKVDKLVSVDSQTTYNIDQEIKKLTKSKIQAQVMNEQLKKFLKNNMDQEKREKMELTGQILNRDKLVKTLHEKIDQKDEIITKLEKRNRLVLESLKNQKINDPVEYFNNLTDNSKYTFMQELKQRGLLKQSQYLEPRKYERSTLKQHSMKKSERSQTKLRINEDYTQEFGEQTKPLETFKKGMKKRRSVENNNYQEMPKVKKSFEGKQLEVENHHKDKKESFKMSKKHILINKNMPVDYSNNQQGKVRVFEIHQKSEISYNQTILSGNGSGSGSGTETYLKLDQQSVIKPKIQIQEKGRYQNLNKTPQQKQILGNPGNRLSIHQDISKDMNQSDYNDDKTQKMIQMENGGLSPTYSSKSKQKIGHKRRINSKKSKTKITSKKQIPQENRRERSPNIMKKESRIKKEEKKVVLSTEPIEIVKRKIFHQFSLCLSEGKVKFQVFQRKKGSKSSLVNFLRCSSLEKSQNGSKQETEEVYVTNEGKLTPTNAERTKSILKSDKILEVISQKEQKEKQYKRSEGKLNKTISKVNSSKKIYKNDDNMRTMSNNFEGKIGQNKQRQNSKVRQLENTQKQRNRPIQTFKKQSSIPKRLINSEKTSFYQGNQAKVQAKDKINESQRQKQNTYSFSSNLSPFRNLTDHESSYNDALSFKNLEERKTAKNETGATEKYLEEEAIEIAKKCKNNQQFNEHIVNIHKSRCGSYCKHLKRYVQNFAKYKNYKSRSVLKIHIENMNEHINPDDEKINFPNINKK